MNECEFCGKIDSTNWMTINENSRLFCTEDHGIKFENLLKSLKFHAGWATVDLLFTESIPPSWKFKAIRGIAEIEFELIFDDDNNVTKFQPIISKEK